MKEFGISIRGRVKNFTLPKSQPLIPLFEAVVNSLNAIDERKEKEPDFDNGYISIVLKRSQQLSFNGEIDPLAEVIDITVEDNGIGFNESNFTSFLQSDSTYKEAIGGKGVGRFSWLVAFQRAIIESTYKDDESGFVTRSFEFNLDKNEINDTLVNSTRDSNITSVKLQGFMSPYRESMPKQLSTIAMRVVHHCLIYFMSDNCPKIIISDGLDSINLNQLFAEKIKSDGNVDSFIIGDNQFELLHVKAEDPSLNGNRLFLCAHSRLVERKDLDKYIKIEFQTAWSAPHPILGKLSEMYPEISFEHQWADEDIGMNCGRRTYLGGEMIDEYIPEGIRATDFALKVWDYDPAEFGMAKNSTGTAYINIEDEKYQLIELLGRRMLFTNGRITGQDIPQGLYFCHLRHSDDGGHFCSVEPKVGVNHGGSIIMNEPLDFGKKGYIPLTEHTEPNFIGKNLSIAQYMCGDLEQTKTAEQTLGGISL